MNAESTAVLNATVSNDATAQAAAFFKAEAMSASAVLASSKVSSLAHAFIEYTTIGTVQAGGGVFVTANDAASVNSLVSMGNTARATNDLGLGNSGDLRFYTQTDAASPVVTERLRIEGEGDIGIGITNPIAMLHIERSSDTDSTLREQLRALGYIQ